MPWLREFNFLSWRQKPSRRRRKRRGGGGRIKEKEGEEEDEESGVLHKPGKANKGTAGLHSQGA